MLFVHLRECLLDHPLKSRQSVTRFPGRNYLPRQRIGFPSARIEQRGIPDLYVKRQRFISSVTLEQLIEYARLSSSLMPIWIRVAVVGEFARQARESAQASKTSNTAAVFQRHLAMSM